MATIHTLRRKKVNQEQSIIDLNKKVQFKYELSTHIREVKELPKAEPKQYIMDSFNTRIMFPNKKEWVHGMKTTLRTSSKLNNGKILIIGDKKLRVNHLMETEVVSIKNQGNYLFNRYNITFIN